ncbi:hypothetical protein LN042_05920 [Kitasatospora sp. RB6PN24]|uniref:hypothetical protein n=1 Tax=Kitasatospora humi TaxID=2893891 RepID=UPI001E44062B|nr:hypothetical protein [Kitasatospora humi]MCC9306649.1 hypothetical protein [Kitasatospora humi]
MPWVQVHQHSDGELISAMTAGSQGPEEGAGGAPQDDDPFGYLYRPAGGAPGAEQPPAAPRTAYRPMEVGRAQYGQQAAYGQPPQYGQQAPRPPQGPPPSYLQQQPGPGYGEPAAQLPHQQPRYAERSRPRPGEDAPRGRGKGAVIGVVAVIAAIAIGAGIALSSNDGTKKDNAAPAPATGAGHPSAGSAAPSASAPASAASSPPASPSPVSGGFVDASKAQPGGGATLTNAVKGAVSADGSYLQMQQGSTATFTVTVPTAATPGKIWLHYGNLSGGPVHVAISVNGKDHDGGTTFKSWNTGGDPTKSWSYTWVSPDLPAGTDTIVVTTTGGPVMLDQIALTGTDTGNDYPSQGPASPTG